jgi:invasion protein IalB
MTHQIRHDKPLAALKNTGKAMTNLFKFCAILAVCAAPAWAQSTTSDTDQTAPAGTVSTDGDAGIPLQLGEEEAPSGPQPGQTYVLEEAGAWEIRCVKRPEGAEQPDPCQLYQLLKDQEGNSVAEINMLALPAGSAAAAGANVVVPLETLLTERLTMAIDGGPARKYPFAFCSQVGCLARLGFADADVANFKRGNVAKLTIVPAVAPDQKVELDVSLSGFTAGFARLQELSAQ